MKQNIQESNYKLAKRVSLLSWIRANSVAIPAILYAFVAVVGVAYNVVFFSHFSINVISYYGITDYLLSGLHHPLALVVFLMVMGLFAVFGRMASYIISRSSFGGQVNTQAYFEYKTEMRKSFLRVGVTTIAIAYCIALALIFPRFAAHQVDACNERVTIAVKPESNGQSKFAELVLLGSTQNFLFLTDLATKTDTVVPIDAIQYLTSRRSDYNGFGSFYCMIFR